MPADLRDESIVEIIDLRKSVANQIYSRCFTIEEKRLAEKIYDSEGNTEYSDDEIQLLMQASKTSGFTIPFQDALNKVITSSN